jgi:hypothetical protein
MHFPQSCGQVKQFSPAFALQTPLPHVSQKPQSSAQLIQSSPFWQMPSPHFVQTPQS